MESSSPQHWRESARTARVAAEYMIDNYSKHLMLEIADRYDLIAQRAEAKTGVALSPSKGQ